MATPQLPIRKGPSIDVSPNGPHMGGGVANPVRKSAAPFGSVDKSVYNRTPAPITPTSSPVNDKDAGKGTGNVR